MSSTNGLLDEARISDVEQFYLEMGSEASSSDPIADSIASQVEDAKHRVAKFLETIKDRPVALVTVRHKGSPSFRVSGLHSPHYLPSPVELPSL